MDSDFLLSRVLQPSDGSAWSPRYDRMSARELFRRVGVSERLYTDAFEPMLLVGLFAPGTVTFFLLHL